MATINQDNMIGKFAKIDPNGRFGDQAQRTDFHYGEIEKAGKHEETGRIWYSMRFPNGYTNSYTIEDIIMKPEDWDE